jgi:hypothetical protein
MASYARYLRGPIASSLHKRTWQLLHLCCAATTPVFAARRGSPERSDPAQGALGVRPRQAPHERRLALCPRLSRACPRALAHYPRRRLLPAGPIPVRREEPARRVLPSGDKQTPALCSTELPVNLNHGGRAPGRRGRGDQCKARWKMDGLLGDVPL